MANAGHHGMGVKGDGAGAGANAGDPGDATMLGEEGLAMQGSNRLHGEDQERVHNERREQANARLVPDSGPPESADMLDKDARAKAELGKGGGVHPDMKQGGVS